jgi:hypothetical protein
MWQDDYWAVSVGENYVKQTRKYIFYQEKHHQKSSFEDEADEFADKYALDLVS